MKRPILIGIVVLIVARFFVGAIVKLANTPRAHAPQFNVGKLSDEHMQMGKFDDGPDRPRPAQKAQSTIRPMTTTVPALPTKIAAAVPRPVAAKPASEEAQKKEKARRKKRKKKLEKQIAKKPEPAQYRVVMNPAAWTNPTPPPAYSGGRMIPKPAADNGPSAGGALPPDQTIQTFQVSAVQKEVNINMWIGILTQHPSPKQMREFLALYRGKQITEEQFYTVLTAMERSHDALAQFFAASAASQYTNIYSFHILSDIIQNPTADPQAKGQAGKGMAAYEDVSQLSVLNEALTKGDAEDKAQVLAIFGTIVRNYASAARVSRGVRQTLIQIEGWLRTALSDPTTTPDIQANAQEILNQIDSVINNPSV